jgi:tetratricopeptide (TPR) repeat protein
MNDRGDIRAAEEHFTSAQMLHRQGRLAEAELAYRAAVALDGSHSDAKEWLGALCLQIEKIDEAICWLSAAAELRPERAAFHDNLAAALMRAQRPQEAAEALRRSLAAAPDLLETRVRLGDALLLGGRPGEAMDYYEQAVAMDRQLKAVLLDPARAATDDERQTVILENCRRTLVRYPHCASYHYYRACALLSLGRIEEACHAAEQALVLNPTLPVYYHILVNSGNAAQKAAAVDALEKLATQEAAIPVDGAAMLHLLLAKAYDEQGRIEEAFAQMQRGNELKRGTISYDEARELGRMSAIADVFSPERLASQRGAGNATERPVFVVGMLRSGTTLIEQILASHPEVYGAGELDLLPDLVREGAAGAGFPAGFAALSPDGLGRLGEIYAAKLASLAPKAKRVVDKMPLNFLHVGLIHLALPNARIVHIKRDPLDTCLSCYLQMFAGDAGFVYNLGELGRYYKAYEALMAHWRAALPEGAMLEVQYEDLVNDLEGQARRIVEYCRLEWNARCLEFYKTKRAVSTASLVQVRQPLFRTSIGRWRPYKEQLRPLLDALDLGSD